MPMTVQNVAGGTAYSSPFEGRPGPTSHVKVDLSGLTVDEVDVNGYLKPGVPLTTAGVLVGAAGIAYGVTPEAVKLPLAAVPPTNTTLGTETADCFVAVATSGLVNRDRVEDMLGRVLTANEIAGLTTVAGSRFTLTRT
jgi:hypothetical protein